jgi:HD-like signal output (HDOD) protein
MLSKKAHIVMVVDPQVNPLGKEPVSYMRTQRNLEDLGIVLVLAQNANEQFYQPLVADYVVAGLPTGADLTGMTAEERAQMLDKRLDAVSKFPALPDTQRRVSEVNDLDPPKKWADAIDPDVATKTVILKILNSARYGFRSRVETIEQAVALASAKTIREIVMACQVRQLFQKTQEQTIEQFWRHSLATAFFAKLFSLPADPAEQTPPQKLEFDRFRLDAEQVRLLQRLGLWLQFKLGEKDEPFTAGLLHDLGKVTMTMCLEESLELVLALIDDEFQECQREKKLWARSAVDLERFLMKDMDHQVIGRRLAERWELQPALQDSIGAHHDLPARAPDLVRLIALANTAASTLFPYPATEAQHPFPLLFGQVEKAIKKKAGKSMEDAVLEAVSQDVFEDLVDVLNRLQLADSLWEIIDFKSFFQLCYMVGPQVRSSAIAFLQQTGK